MRCKARHDHGGGVAQRREPVRHVDGKARRAGYSPGASSTEVHVVERLGVAQDLSGDTQVERDNGIEDEDGNSLGHVGIFGNHGISATGRASLSGAS